MAAGVILPAPGPDLKDNQSKTKVWEIRNLKIMPKFRRLKLGIVYLFYSYTRCLYSQKG